jgi:hypothetical protein
MNNNPKYNLMQLMDKIVIYKLLNNERTDKTIKIKPNNNKKVNA